MGVYIITQVHYIAKNPTKRGKNGVEKVESKLI